MHITESELPGSDPCSSVTGLRPWTCCTPSPHLSFIKMGVLLKPVGRVVREIKDLVQCLTNAENRVSDMQGKC